MTGQPSDVEQSDLGPGWGVYRGRTLPPIAGTPPPVLPDPPPWRQFPRNRARRQTTNTTAGAHDYRGEIYQADAKAIEMVNAALYLRRPLLVTGKPGAGKSTLAYAVARELQLGKVLRWNITSRTTLRDGLYHYDALARLNDYNMKKRLPIGSYINLGPLATALLPNERTRVLLIDEIDKADIDLPNDLLNIFEEGAFDIPELIREQKHATAPGATEVTTSEGEAVSLGAGHVECTQFPFVVLTSNGEREFPPPFLRRCVRLYLPSPDDKMLARIVDAHLPIRETEADRETLVTERRRLIIDFVQRGRSGDLATDQLLNAVFLAVGPKAGLNEAGVSDEARKRLLNALLRHLSNEVPQEMLLEPALSAVAAEPQKPVVSE